MNGDKYKSNYTELQETLCQFISAS